MGVTELDDALAIVKAAGFEVRKPKDRPTFEGVFTVHRIPKPGRSPLARRAYYANSPGWIMLPTSEEHPRGWQVRFRRTPEALLGCTGHRIRVTCSPRVWANGLGADAMRPLAECLDQEEHVLAALAALGDPKRRRP